ncbi:hypothetical protein CBM2599_B50365 [Cupriavidus taiwanensis]|nr:hypothetical protein CBM2600_B10626 [Cupriavidus taiwanensis]SOY96433.1 hypothetical protein CBM2599_B50365 [Cupriavidus taiwanensis]
MNSVRYKAERLTCRPSGDGKLQYVAS